MSQSLLHSMREQTRPAIDAVRRDTFKRILSAVLIVGVFVWLGETMVAVALVLTLPTGEFLMRVLLALLPENDQPIPDGPMVLIWVFKFSWILVSLSPSYALAGTGGLPLIIAAYLWWFCLCSHVSNVYAGAPLLLWTLLTPALMIAALFTWRIYQNQSAPHSEMSWVIAAACLMFFVFNLIESMRRQSESSRELRNTQIEANARLKALEHLSRHDSLTGLLNRRAFDDVLANMLGKGGDDDVAVMIVDLDGFKPINDTYSHEAGDLVLQTIARRLVEVAGDNGVVARLGGDEFALAFRSIRSDRMALRLAAYLARDIERPVTFDQKELQVGASIGVSLASLVGTSIEALCSCADQAMYRAKGQPGEKAVLYRTESFGHRATLEDRAMLSEALIRREIRPYYQPKVNLNNGAIIGFEALARWVHPVDGLRSPATFIPAINELGLQGDFLLRIAEQVLADITTMRDEGLDPGQVSINVPEVALATHSGRQDLEALLDQHPRARQHVTLEITEDVFIARASDVIRDSINRFRRAGQRVSLDDFGTGFASFQHLRQLDFDELKIDTSFVAGLGEDKRNEVLIRGFISMAQGLEVSVVAEGVETERQAEMLAELGCLNAQGYLFGKAMPFDEILLRLHVEAIRNNGGSERRVVNPAEASPPLAVRGV